MITNEFGREIRVYVRDAKNQLLPGTRIEWTENGSPRGTIEFSDGHATLSPAEPESIIEVRVEYKNEQQTRKLAVEQTDCTFHYAQQNIAGPTTDSVNQEEKTSLYKNPVVIAATIAAIASLIVGYFQYFKPTASAEVMLAVFVKDAISGRPVPRAEVILQRASRREPGVTDDEGTARFQINKNVERDIVVSAHAAGYKDATLSYDAPTQDYHVELSLIPQSPPKVVPQTSAPEAPSHASKPRAASKPPLSTLPPTGTWKIKLVGDIGAQRAKEGSFVFTPQPDERLLLSARVEIDDAQVNISGQAARQHQIYFITFDASSGDASWTGRGELVMLDNKNMRGHITDAAGIEIPIQLQQF